MKSKTLMCLTAITVFGALAIPIRLAAQDQQNKKRPHYMVTDLGTLGGTFSEAHGLNNGGSAAGQSLLPGDVALHAFVWPKGIMTDLGTLGGPDSLVNVGNHTVSERGWVVGYSEISVADPNGEDFCTLGTHLVCLPFVWENGRMTALPTLGGTNGQALGINNRGQIVGEAEGPNPDPCSPFALEVKAVVWRNGQIERVLAPFGGSAALAMAINDNGDAVGLSGCNTGTSFAVLGGTENRSTSGVWEAHLATFLSTSTIKVMWWGNPTCPVTRSTTRFSGKTV